MGRKAMVNQLRHLLSSPWRIGSAIVVVVAAAVGVWLLGQGHSSWARVEERDLLITVDVSGQLEAVESLDYGPPPVTRMFNFTVAFMAPEGSIVEAGDPVVGFDTTELRERLITYEVDRDSADKSIEKRTVDLEVVLREAELALYEAQADSEKAGLKANVSEGLLATVEVAKARLDVEMAEAAITFRETRIEYLNRSSAAELRLLRERRDRALSEVRDIERQIETMTVRTARRGTVVYKTSFGREKKKVGDRTWRFEKIIEIPDLTQMRVVAEVEEAESGRVRSGQIAKLRLDAHPERIFEAVVDTIHTSVEQRSRRDPRRVVRLELALSTSDPEIMRPGMRMQGTIEVGRLQSLMTIPIEAVVARARGPVVRVRRALGTVERNVRLGRRTDEWVEVIEGLELGDEVALDV